MSEQAASPSNVLGIVLRVGMFAVLGWLANVVFAFLLYPITGLLVAAALSVFGAAAVANTVAVRVFERGRLADCGLGWGSRSAREFFMGSGASIVLASLVIAIPLAAGQAKFTPATTENPWVTAPFVSVMLLFGASGEEMLFHGYAFQLLIRKLGPFATILPAAVLFGLAHLGNEGASPLGVANTMAWGGVLGYAFYRTRALWLPIGLHFGWNVTLPLLGANLSGFTMGVTGYALEWSGSNLWGGGSYGPEGGLPTTVAVVVLAVLLPRLAPEAEAEHSGTPVGEEVS